MRQLESGKQVGWESGGCQHDTVAVVFPELAHLIKWHLSGTDGPMYYLENALHFAGDRDCWGRGPGETFSWDHVVTFGGNPIQHKLGKGFAKFLEGAGPDYDFEVIAIPHQDRGDGYKFSPKYTFGGFADKWHECPFDSEVEAVNFLYALQHCEPKIAKVPTAWSEGKARGLDLARSAAVWPDATDEELTSPGLRERLEERLPGLLVEFRAAVEGAGFTW